MYNQEYVDNLKMEIDHWRKQCLRLQKELFNATFKVKDVQ